MIVGGKDVGDRPLILAPMEEVTNPPFGNSVNVTGLTGSIRNSCRQMHWCAL